jgi:hypothetical protein
MKGGIEMNFKDRGNKKWTSLMLVEHRKRLKELKEHECDREKPILDNQEKTAIDSKLQQALQNDLELKIKFYENKQFKLVNGRIEEVDINQKIIFVDNKKIPIKNLLEVDLK